MRKEEILAACIDDVRSGKYTQEECLARYPRLSRELRPLLDIAVRIRPKDARLSPAFRQRLAAALAHEMQLSSGKTRTHIFSWPDLLFPSWRIIRVPVAATAAALMVVGASGSAVYASQGSLPDDTLYPVKRGVENFQLAVAPSSEAKVGLWLKMSQRRLDEVTTQSKLGQQVSVSALQTMTDHLEGTIAELGNLAPEESKVYLSRLVQTTLDQQLELDQFLETSTEATRPALKNTIDATRRGNLIAQIAYDNPSLLKASPSVRDERLESSHFRIEGALVDADNGSTWNISGLPLTNVSASQRSLPQGSTVSVEGLVRGNKVYVGKVNQQTATQKEVKIEGIFTGTSADGATWFVGGVPVFRPENATPPPPGTRLELKGTIKNNMLVPTKVENQETKTEGRVGISGSLVQVNPDVKTITIDNSGVNVTVRVSNAEIKDDDKQPITLNEIGAASGQRVEIDHLEKQEGKLSTKDVRVSVKHEEDERRSSDSRSTDSKSTDSRSSDSRSTDSKSTDSKSTDSKSTDSKSTDSRSSDSKSTDSRSTTDQSRRD